MALSATLAELETWIRQDADMQAPDDRVTSEECRNRINRSLAQLYDRLVLVDQEYFLKGVTVTSNGSGKYDIMNDFATGVVRSVASVQFAGTGYANGASVTLSQGANATATGVITATGGAITGVTLTSGGFGYVDAPIPVTGWALQSSQPLSVPSAYAGAPLNVGGYIVFLAYGLSGTFLCKYDPATLAIATSASLGSNVHETIAYDDLTNNVVAVNTGGDMIVIDANTLAHSTISTGLPSITSFGVVCDNLSPGRELYFMHGSDLYQADISGAITGSASTTHQLQMIGKSETGGVTSVILYRSSTNELSSMQVPSFVLTSLGTVANDIVSCAYASTPDKLYLSGLTEAYCYDYTALSLTDVTAQLAMPGYVYGPSFVTYDQPNDRVWYGSFSLSASQYVIALNGSTSLMDTSIQYTGAAAVWAFALGSSVYVSGSLVPVPTAGSVIYAYSYSGTQTSSPNYVLLNVSGGNGGQVIAYIESDFYKCKGVWFTDGNGTEPDNGNWYPLRRFSWEQQNALNQSALYDGLRALPLYRIVTEGTRDKLLISPDQLSGSYKLWYYPAPPRLLASTDRFDGRAGWDEWIVKDVAIQLLMAEESVEQAATLKNVRDEIWQRIQLHAEDREAAQPQRIMDATLMSRRYGPRWGR